MHIAAGEDDRMWFDDDPWPRGHRLANFAWSGRIDPEVGLAFSLDLSTEEYDAEDPPREEASGAGAGGGEDEYPNDDDDDDDDKGLWLNYHSCSISTARGFVVGTAAQPLDFATLAGRVFQVDPLTDPDHAPVDDDDDYAFHVYRLGHDSVAGHKIGFTRQLGPFEFAIDWTGKLAQTYVGDDHFGTVFRVRVLRAAFAGFRIPTDVDEGSARRVFESCVLDPSLFRLGRIGAEAAFVPVVVA